MKSSDKPFDPWDINTWSTESLAEHDKENPRQETSEEKRSRLGGRARFLQILDDIQTKEAAQLKKDKDFRGLIKSLSGGDNSFIFEDPENRKRRETERKFRGITNSMTKD